jgi:hypothetical protein
VQELFAFVIIPDNMSYQLAGNGKTQKEETLKTLVNHPQGDHPSLDNPV